MSARPVPSKRTESAAIAALLGFIFGALCASSFGGFAVLRPPTAVVRPWSSAIEAVGAREPIELTPSAPTEPGPSSSPLPLEIPKDSRRFRRRARLPSPQVALERCLSEGNRTSSRGISSQDRVSLGLEDQFTATNSVHAQQSGEVLIGECKCPMKTSHPDPTWSFDCREWDHKILTELAPWHSVNITHAMLDFASGFNTANLPPTYHMSYKNGKGYWKFGPGAKGTAYHDSTLSMLGTFAELVEMPDAEFLLSTWDHQKVPRQDPSPVFATIKDLGRNDVVIPHAHYWSQALRDFDLAPDPQCAAKSWEEREQKVAWRGSCTGPTLGYQPALYSTYLRVRATELTRQFPELLNTGLTGPCVEDSAAVNRSGAPLGFLDVDKGACNHQSLLLLDGNTISGRSVRWFSSGSTVFKPDSIFSEWYYRLLKPWVHYVPVLEFLEDLPEVAAYMRENPALGKCIAENSVKFAKRYLNKWTAACYMWRLMSVWGAQQPNGVRTEGFQQMG